jgi:hypothetical protein
MGRLLLAGRGREPSRVGVDFDLRLGLLVAGAVRASAPHVPVQDRLREFCIMEHLAQGGQARPYTGF